MKYEILNDSLISAWNVLNKCFNFFISSAKHAVIKHKMNKFHETDLYIYMYITQTITDTLNSLMSRETFQKLNIKTVFFINMVDETESI